MTPEPVTDDRARNNGDVWTEHGHAGVPCSPPQAVRGQAACRLVAPVPVADDRARVIGSGEVDTVARVLMAAWEQAEGKPVSVSYVATFADMARAILAHRAAPDHAPTTSPEDQT